MKWRVSLLSALVVFCIPPQTHAQAQTAPTVSTQPGQAPKVPLPSSLLNPTMAGVQQTLTDLNFEKWRRGSIRDEANSNAQSIINDIQENMPPLLKNADAAPSSVSMTLPLAAHVNALYEVLLRVVEASRVSAPGEQAATLQQSLLDMSKARRALEDQLQQNAAVQEKEINTLRASLTAQAAARPQAIPVPMVLPCGAFVVRRPVRRHTAPAATGKKPATSTTPQPQKK